MGKSNPNREPCSVDGCAKMWHARKLCPMHLFRLRKYGTTEQPGRGRFARSGECREPACTQPVQNLGQCSTHYARSWRQTPNGAKSSKARDHKRRATILNADSGCWFAREAYVDLIQHDPCVYCGAWIETEIEHISPISKSLDDSWTNLAPACRSCNASKHDRDVLGFMLGRV